MYANSLKRQKPGSLFKGDKFKPEGCVTSGLDS